MIASETRWAHDELRTRLRPFIAQRVSPCDVDDVLQDVFVRVHRGVGQLRDDDRFGSWIYRVARSAIAEHRRTKLRHPLAREGVELEDSPADATDAEPPEVARALALCVLPFVAMLPSPYREALTLTELEGRSQKEAAEMIGISLSGMKSRVQRGRAQLRALFEACCEISLDARGQVMTFEPRGASCGCGPRD